VAQERRYGGLNHANDEPELVSSTGLLNIGWLQSMDSQPLGVDIVLATATNPTISNGRYATSKEIADAWTSRSGSVHAKYYWNNRSHGITTFQDADIASYLAANTEPSVSGSPFAE